MDGDFAITAMRIHGRRELLTTLVVLAAAIVACLALAIATHHVDVLAALADLNCRDALHEANGLVFRALLVVTAGLSGGQGDDASEGEEEEEDVVHVGRVPAGRRVDRCRCVCQGEYPDASDISRSSRLSVDFEVEGPKEFSSR
mgnify:CR=1 FL=1